MNPLCSIWKTSINLGKCIYYYLFLHISQPYDKPCLNSSPYGCSTPNYDCRGEKKHVDNSEVLECLFPIINPSNPLARHVYTRPPPDPLISLSMGSRQPGRKAFSQIKTDTANRCLSAVSAQSRCSYKQDNSISQQNAALQLNTTTLREEVH